MKGMDPFGSMKGMVGRFQQFMSNPMQFMINNRLNLPQNFSGDANQAIQYLMNSGQLTQEQYNWAQGMSRRIQSNPQFQQLMNR